jgi:uncharacterized protein YndB with AHSA1/START domain
MTPKTEIGRTEFTTPSDRELSMIRAFDAPRRLVWTAWTSPEHVPKWMLGPPGWSMPVCEMDLRPGGAWRFVWRRKDGSEMAMTGVYKEIIPPERLVSTENWGGEWPESINTVLLTEHGSKTEMNLTVLYVSKEARDAAMETGMKDGVDASFNRLAEWLGSMC